MIVGRLAVANAPSSSLLPPDDRARVNGEDWELGAPAGAADLSERLSTWKARINGANVEVSNNLVDWQLLLALPGVDPASFTYSFDQNMRGMISYQLTGSTDIKLYWYDLTIPGYTTITVANAKSPFLTFDFPFDSSVSGAGVMWYYIRGTTVYCRMQSDRFTIEYTFGTVPSGRTQITGAGMGNNWRIHLRFGR